MPQVAKMISERWKAADADTKASCQSISRPNSSFLGVSIPFRSETVVGAQARFEKEAEKAKAVYDQQKADYESKVRARLQSLSLRRPPLLEGFYFLLDCATDLPGPRPAACFQTEPWGADLAVIIRALRWN
jgi:hypothetical protein